jgi:hypothetical protein
MLFIHTSSESPGTATYFHLRMGECLVPKTDVLWSKPRPARVLHCVSVGITHRRAAEKPQDGQEAVRETIIINPNAGSIVDSHVGDPVSARGKRGEAPNRCLSALTWQIALCALL